MEAMVRRHFTREKRCKANPLTQALTRTLTPTLSLALTLTRCTQLTEAERIGQQVRAIGHLVIATFSDAVTWLSPLQVGAIGGVLKKGSLTFLDQRRCNNAIGLTLFLTLALNLTLTLTLTNHPGPTLTRWNNIAIGLTKLGLANEVLRRAVLALDESVLTEAAVALLTLT